MEFKSRNPYTINWPYFSKPCERLSGDFPRRWADSDASNIHCLIRSFYRYILDVNCCTRERCPFNEQGRYTSRRGNYWDKIGGPPRWFRKEPHTLSALGAAVLISTTNETEAGAITSFTMSNVQQTKVNEEVTKLSRLVGELGKIDQTQ